MATTNATAPALPNLGLTWGEHVVIAVFRWSGAGINDAVKRIHAEVGPHVGVRNTFSKLLKVEHPQQLGERDRFRAWLLLTTLGQDPRVWAIRDDVVPPGFDVGRLRQVLPLPLGSEENGPAPDGSDGVVSVTQRFTTPPVSTAEFLSLRKHIGYPGAARPDRRTPRTARHLPEQVSA